MLRFLQFGEVQGVLKCDLLISANNGGGVEVLLLFISHQNRTEDLGIEPLEAETTFVGAQTSRLRHVFTDTETLLVN